MKKISARQFLVEVKELIKSPCYWCKNAWAKTKRGIGVQPDHPEARRWCLGGAMRCIDKKYPGNDAYTKAHRKVKEVIKNCAVIDFNDSHTHKEVIEVLDTAINSLTRRKKCQEEKSSV
jgi:hypothetical protein